MADIIVDEIPVLKEKKKLVADASERIRLLFKVDVTLSSESSGYQWIQLKGQKEGVDKTKEYIKSLCNPEIEGARVRFSDKFYEAIYNYKNHVEKKSGAVVMFCSSQEVVLQGSEMAVAMATSLIEDRVRELKAGLNGLPELLENGDKDHISPSVPKRREYEPVQASPRPHIDPSLEEFAMKLGYTREDIHQVVRKQGKEVDQNTLLHELIKVSTPLRPRQPEVCTTMQSGLTPTAIPSRRGDVVARGTPAPRHAIYENTHSNSGSQAERLYVTERPEEEVMIYQQVVGKKETSRDSDLRHIVIDGSNVAMSHGNQECFSCQGIKLCVDWFKHRGHNEITVFIPQWRKETPRSDSPMKDQDILFELEHERHLVFTPSRRVNGRRIVCYDDRFIVRLAAETDGVIVSNDNFRDLFNENPKWQEVIEQRILMYSFVKDIFMVPDDPLGRHGPALDDFLKKGTVSHPRICPYLRRCTYGLRCRYYHPERDPARKDTTMASSVQRDPADVLVRGYHGGTQYLDTMQMPRATNHSNAPQRIYNPNPPYRQQYPGMPYDGTASGMGGRQVVTCMYPTHTTRPNYELSDGPSSAVFNNLKTIFQDCEDVIVQVMREYPNADMARLADIIATRVASG